VQGIAGAVQRETSIVVGHTKSVIPSRGQLKCKSTYRKLGCGLSGTANQVDQKEARLVSWSDGHCPGSTPSLSYTTLIPLPVEALAAIGRALRNHN
jgi:hypothetical protein